MGEEVEVAKEDVLEVEEREGQGLRWRAWLVSRMP